MWKDDACLLEMLQAARDALAFLQGCDEAGFLADLRLQSAVMMKLVVIGENANKVSKEFRETHPEIPWHAMYGIRNVLVHAYGQVILEKPSAAASVGISAACWRIWNLARAASMMELIPSYLRSPPARCPSRQACKKKDTTFGLLVPATPSGTPTPGRTSQPRNSATSSPMSPRPRRCSIPATPRSTRNSSGRGGADEQDRKPLEVADAADLHSGACSASPALSLRL